MRTFHTGGVAGADDITQGLPRVEELFEARKPKHPGILSESEEPSASRKRKMAVLSSSPAKMARKIPTIFHMGPNFILPTAIMWKWATA